MDRSDSSKNPHHSTSHHGVIIIGAGLSGLYAAWRLNQRQLDILVLDARERVGGRILSPLVCDSAASRVDIGPAWVWPAFQSRLNGLLSEFKLEVFNQYTTGDMLYEQDAKTVQRYSAQSSHQHSYRIAEGVQALIHALQSALPKKSVRVNAKVTMVEQLSEDSALIIHAEQDQAVMTYTADKVILALPPRIAQNSIQFNPPLDKKIEHLWQNIPTWMAGFCKIIFIYQTPFWREQKLSGEVFSQCGPLSEIYDGSPIDEECFALTSFVRLNALQRQQVDANKLIAMCMAQLQRLFGDASQNVTDVQIKDWSCDACTSSLQDLNPARQHPQYPGDMSRELWSGKMLLAGTEVAREHGGYLEGALESVDEILPFFSV